MTKKTSKRSSETKIRNMRQGQQKIKLDIKKPSPSSPPLPLPFPPTQRVEQIVAKLVAKPRLARFPNAFIMYRNEYVQYLKSQGYHISMTELSPMISASWKKESEVVKEAYTKLSSEAEKLYVRDTGSTQQQINYKYLPAQRPTLTTKIDSEIVNPKLDDPPRQSHQLQHNSNFDENDIFNNINNIYGRLYYPIPQNEFSRNYTKESEQIPSFPIGTSELAKYSLDNVSLPQAKIDCSIPQPESCFAENFFQWAPSNTIHHNQHPPVSYGPAFSPSTVDDLMSPSSIIGLSLDTQMLESMSPPSSSNSSSASEASFDEITSLLFEESRFFDKNDFSTPNYSESINGQSPLSPPPDLYLYPGQSFPVNPPFQNKI